MHRRGLRASASLALACLLLIAAVPTGGAASAEGVAAGWRQTLVIDSQTAGAEKMFEAFDTASLNLYDFNGDGQLEIVSNNDNNVVYVLDSRTGKALAQIETFHYNNSRWPVRELNPVSIGDLYGDGVPCMVIPNSASFMSAWCFNGGASSATSFQFDKKWEIKVDAALYEDDFEETHPWLFDKNGTKDSPSIDGHAYLADADGDGRMEIFVETDGYPGQFAFDADGKYLWSRSWWDGNAGAKVLDIDKDGTKEALFVSDAGVIAAYNAKSGGVEWIFESSENGAWPGSVPVPPLVADLHGDGHFETVFGARNVSRDQSDPNWVNESHARYFAIDSKGKILWSVSYDWMNPLQYNHPAAADINKDGVLDVVFLDWNTVGHKPGNWNTTNRPANLFALNGKDGSLLWRSPITIYWSNKDFVIADVDGDGEQEVVAPTAKGGSDGLGVYRLSDGKYEGWFPIDWSLSRGPVGGDLYGDGQTYLVVPVMKKIHDRPNYRSLDVGLREGQLRIVATGAAWDPVFSANFLFSEEDSLHAPKGTSGTAPAPPTTDTTTSPPPTTASPPPDTGDTTPPPPPTPDAGTTTPPPTDATPDTVTTPPDGGTTPPVTTTPEENAAPSPTSNTVPGPGAAFAVAALAGALALVGRRRRL